MENYFEQAVSCVKDYVPPMQRQIYEKCAGDFDRIYGEAMNSDLYTGKVIDPGNSISRERALQVQNHEKVKNGQEFFQSRVDRHEWYSVMARACVFLR